MSIVVEPPQVVYIYALRDPRNGETRYIGKAVDPRNRLKQHIYEATRGSRSHHKNWVRSLLNRGLQPELTILQACSGDTWIQAEQFWIAHSRAMGCSLTNKCDGGQGTHGYQWTEDRKAHMRAVMVGRKMPLEVVETRCGRFIVTAPDGTELEILGLAPFCRQHGLNLSPVLEGRARHSHGWTIRRLGEPRVELTVEDLKGLPYVVTDPEGHHYLVRNVTAFALEFGVSRSDLQQSFNRKAAYGGWQMTRAIWLEGQWRIPENVPCFPEFVKNCACPPEKKALQAERMRGEGNPFFGRKHTDEAKAKVSKARMGRPSPKKGKPAPPHAYDRLRKTYILTSPEGEEILVSNLPQFCLDHGLTRSTLLGVASGKWTHHKGWRIRRANEEPR